MSGCIAEISTFGGSVDPTDVSFLGRVRKLAFVCLITPVGQPGPFEFLR